MIISCQPFLSISKSDHSKKEEEHGNFVKDLIAVYPYPEGAERLKLQLVKNKENNRRWSPSTSRHKQPSSRRRRPTTRRSRCRRSRSKGMETSSERWRRLSTAPTHPSCRCRIKLEAQRKLACRRWPWISRHPNNHNILCSLILQQLRTVAPTPTSTCLPFWWKHMISCVTPNPMTSSPGMRKAMHSSWSRWISFPIRCCPNTSSTIISPVSSGSWICMTFTRPGMGPISSASSIHSSKEAKRSCSKILKGRIRLRQWRSSKDRWSSRCS